MNSHRYEQERADKALVREFKRSKRKCLTFRSYVDEIRKSGIDHNDGLQALAYRSVIVPDRQCIPLDIRNIRLPKPD